MELVSIIIPTHFRADRLKKALDSVINQTYKNLEIIVVSDGYDKETTDYMNEIIKKEKRIKFVNYRDSKGANYARNTGIKKSTGEYIAFLDDDDIWYENKIEKQLEKFVDEKIGLVYCNKLIKYPEINSEYKSISNKSGNLSKEILFDNVIGTTSAVIVRKEVIEKCGYFDEKMPAMQDYDLWIRICQKYEVGLYNEIGIDYYNYKTNKKSSQISSSTEKYVKAREMIFEKYQELFSNLSKDEIKIIKGNNALLLANKALRNGEKKATRKYGKEAWNQSKAKKGLFFIFFSWIPYEWLIKIKSLKKNKIGVLNEKVKY